jgi:clan AA aspartic protease
MISGHVNPDLEAVLSLTVHGAGGQQQTVEVIIDTGFNGSLTLPSPLIAALGLPWLTQGRVELANGSIDVFDVYAGTVFWDGQLIRVMVDAADTTPLVGMTLMHGYELHLPILDGGLVTLNRI